MNKLRNHENHPQPQEITRRYDFMQRVVYEMGNHALHMLKGEVKMRRKGDNSQVTDVDETLNDLLITRAQQFLPGDLVWGEEASNSEKGNLDLAAQRWLWISDPIDGTSKLWRAYQRGKYDDCTSTVLLSGFAPGDHTPTMSMIYSPFQKKRMMLAAGPQGATFQTSYAQTPQRLHLSNGPRRIEEIQRYEASTWGEGLGHLDNLLPFARKVRHQLRMGSVALRDVDLSCFSAPSHPHDVVPGAHIVHATGGAVRSLSGKNYHQVDWRVDPIPGVLAAPTRELADDMLSRLG